MIRKIVVSIPRILLSDGQVTKLEHAQEVVEFKDFGDGIFVPTRIRHGSLDEWESELIVKSVKVNEPIPPETFVLNWPKYAAVVHLPPVNGRNKVEIWDDDKPVGEIKEISELRTIEAELRKDPARAAELGPVAGAPPPPPMSTLVKLFIALGALLAVMIALVIRRRIREQAAV